MTSCPDNVTCTTPPTLHSVHDKQTQQFQSISDENSQQQLQHRRPTYSPQHRYPNIDDAPSACSEPNVLRDQSPRVVVDGGDATFRWHRVRKPPKSKPTTGDDPDDVTHHWIFDPERKRSIRSRIRIVHISDTHGVHDHLTIPAGDVLIHSGDFFKWNKVEGFDRDAEILDEFFAKQPHTHKIFVAGNHELSFDGHSADEIQSRLSYVTYLQDRSVDVGGLVVYGSPWTVCRPESPAYAFTKPQNDMRQQCWNRVPSDIDILVTHSPPYNIIDFKSSPIGCRALRGEVLSRIKPKAHLFGHAHNQAQAIVYEGILFSNGTQGDIQFMKSKPIVIDVTTSSSKFKKCNVA